MLHLDVKVEPFIAVLESLQLIASAVANKASSLLVVLLLLVLHALLLLFSENQTHEQTQDHDPQQKPDHMHKNSPVLNGSQRQEQIEL